MRDPRFKLTGTSSRVSLLNQLAHNVSHENRPWVDSPQAPLMSETTNTTVTFPSEDEDMGEVAINWFGAPITVMILNIEYLAVCAWIESAFVNIALFLFSVAFL